MERFNIQDIYYSELYKRIPHDWLDYLIKYAEVHNYWVEANENNQQPTRIYDLFEEMLRRGQYLCSLPDFFYAITKKYPTIPRKLNYCDEIDTFIRNL